MRRLPTTQASLLLLVSGQSALIYQVVWLRDLRLVFGSSTAATAAVLAIFMGGLGAGGILLGGLADRHPRPLRLYAILELAVSLTALVSPLLLALVRHVYAWSGGSIVLGTGLATIVRLALASIVLLIPTVLMGGTLPAMARAVEDRSDPRRLRLAVVYGCNTLGAVSGVILATFYLLEQVGTLRTLVAACIVNAGLGLVALTLSRSARPVVDTAPGPERVPASTMPGWIAPQIVAILAAALVGFVFFLMEQVWFRMLAPILGGSTYTFGVILAVALLGIGVGGLGFALVGRRRPATIERFARSCGLEALLLAVPLFVGDRLALAVALAQRPEPVAFTSLVGLWFVVALVVVGPVAVVAGYQFPLLVALLGRGRDRVGLQTGRVYAANTIGAVVGALAGGFGAMALLGATGTWRLAVACLCAAALLAGLIGIRWQRRIAADGPRRPVRALAERILLIGVPAAAALLATATGPTALWRHGSIGAGRFPELRTAGELGDWVRTSRAAVLWQADGTESSLAVTDTDALAFMVNGKTDGNSRYDAGTQVMSGLLGAFLHGRPRRVLVVGLGTGSTAGWLAAVPGMERVDVVELERRVVPFARQCGPVNHDALDDPKVHVIIGDGREVLLTTPERYDLICSEPSNPYRAGIASLYTVEYYQAVAERLNEGGLFSQWLQGYEVDLETIKTVVATLATVFDQIELWQTEAGDLQLLCGRERRVLDLPALRRRLTEEPYASAILDVWRATDLEGIFAHYVGNSDLCRDLAAEARWGVNTDDRTFIEYAYARTLGRTGLFDPRELVERADAANQARPAIRGGAVSWGWAREQRLLAYVIGNEQSFASLVRQWRRPARAPGTPLEVLAVAEALAEEGAPAAEGAIRRLARWQPTEAELVRARFEWRRDRHAAAIQALAGGFTRLRDDPWPIPPLVRRALELAPEIARSAPAGAGALLEALSEPFAVHLADRLRRQTAVRVARLAGNEATWTALQALEPHFPFDPDLLRLRRRVYAATGRGDLARADRDVEVLGTRPSRPSLLDLFTPDAGWLLD